MKKDEKVDTIVVGVDIGSTKVTVVAVGLTDKSNPGAIEVIGFSEVKLPSGAVVNGSVENVKQVSEAISKALATVDNMGDIDIRVVNMSYGGMHVKFGTQVNKVIRHTSSTGEIVSQRDVDQLVANMFRAKSDINAEVMHVLPLEFIVDNAIGVKEPVGRSGINLGGEFIIVSADKQSVERSKQSLKMANEELSHDMMLLAPIASGLAVLEDAETAAGIALVDIGSHTTDLVIYYEGIIRHMATFPIGGRHITSDLKMGCSIQMENAENLKKQFGVALSEKVSPNVEILVNYLAGRPPKNVLQKNTAIIIEERLKEIAAMVYAEIISSGQIDNMIGGLVITGGTANIPEIESIFSRITRGMQVRIGRPIKLKSSEMAEKVCNPSYASAVGLAWAGIKAIDPRISSICRSEVIPAPQQLTRKEPKLSGERESPSRGFFSEYINPFLRRGKVDDLGEYGD